MKLNAASKKQILDNPANKVGPKTILPPNKKPPNKQPGQIPSPRKPPKPPAGSAGPPASLMESSVHVLWIPGWHPWFLNKLLGHWAERMLRKKRDKEIVGNAVLVSNVRQAKGKRRVEVIYLMGKGRKRVDNDNAWKSILDALKHAGAIVNDSPNWCEHERPQYARCIEPCPPGTLIILTDLSR